MALNHCYDTGSFDLATACAWLSKYQHLLPPKDGGFLLPDFAAKVHRAA